MAFCSGLAFCSGTVFCSAFCSLKRCFVHVAKFGLNSVRVQPTLFGSSPGKFTSSPCGFGFASKLHDDPSFVNSNQTIETFKLHIVSALDLTDLTTLTEAKNYLEQI